MRAAWARVRIVRDAIAWRLRKGLPEAEGSLEHEALVVLDGVGGLQWSVDLTRAALSGVEGAPGTVMFRWQTPIRGNVLADLMMKRRNRLQGARLARKLLALKRRNPGTKLHMLAFSGGSGIAVFALESLRGRPIVETLVLACPALSPEYPLGRALSCVRRAYALTSERDRLILGLGTTVFGTVDRRHCPAAGRVGFALPDAASATAVEFYVRLRELRWTPELRKLGHHGSHAEWAGSRFLNVHLLPLLRGEPLLETHPVRRRPGTPVRFEPEGAGIGR